MNWRHLILLAYAMPATVTMSVNAYEPERAMVNLSHDMAECAAYFAFVSESPGLDEDTKSTLLTKSGGMLVAATQISNAEVAQARVELAMKTMAREMKHNWSNASIINNKYGYICIDLFDDPEARMKYWLEKED